MLRTVYHPSPRPPPTVELPVTLMVTVPLALSYTVAKEGSAVADCPPVHAPVEAKRAPWFGQVKLPDVICTVVPWCGQVIDNAVNAVALVRTSATGVPVPLSTRAMPPTVASAGKALSVTTSDDGVVGVTGVVTGVPAIVRIPVVALYCVV